MIESDYQTGLFDTLHLQNASYLTEYYPLLLLKPLQRNRLFSYLNISLLRAVAVP